MFISLTDFQGNQVLVNVNQIVTFLRYGNQDTTTIHTTGRINEQALSISVKESVQEIINQIENGGD